MMQNLAEEIHTCLKMNNYSTDDVAYVTDYEVFESIDSFLNRVKEYNYDNTFGRIYINEQLSIVMKDGSWFERYTYDGSEWFEYKRSPAKPSISGCVEYKEH